MYYFEDAVAEETSKAGLRAVLAVSVLDFPTPDSKTWEASLAYAEEFAEKWKGATALHTAAWFNHRETVELLLTRGARTDVKEDVHGGTPIDWADHHGNAALAQWMRKYPPFGV